MFSLRSASAEKVIRFHALDKSLPDFWFIKRITESGLLVAPTLYKWRIINIVDIVHVTGAAYVVRLVDDIF